VRFRCALQPLTPVGAKDDGIGIRLPKNANSDYQHQDNTPFANQSFMLALRLFHATVKPDCRSKLINEKWVNQHLK
jgi:hypothetical protein